METLLTLSGIGFPPYSARGCQQTLQLIEQPALRRTVNGELMAVGNPLFQKYRTTIEGADKHPVAMDQLHMGHPVTVGCIQRLWQEVESQTVHLGRPAVQGSVTVITSTRQPVTFTQVDPRTITLEAPPDGPTDRKVYVGYCPVLETRLVDFHMVMDEWKHTSLWKLILEEV